MNWKKLYMLLNNVLILSCNCVLVGGSLATLVTGICRTAFELDDRYVMYWLWFPIMILSSIWVIAYLPQPLRKMGMLSDNLDSYGPWIKK